MPEPPEIPQLDKKRHIKFFERCLGLLPTKFESEESNKLAICYFSLSGLDLLQSINETFKPEEIKYHIKWIYSHVVETNDYFGFRGSISYQNSGLYDPPNLASTCFALQLLLILGDDLHQINRLKLMKYLCKCQKSDGSFAPFLDIHNQPFGDVDSRYCMLASTIRKIIKWDSTEFDIDVELLTCYVISLKSYDGGLGQNNMLESHAGLTYCGLAALKMVGTLKVEDWEDTVEFLVHRQLDFNKYNQLEVVESDDADPDDVGGFDGRTNKYADTCYGFWCLASLDLLGLKDLVNKDLLMNYLLTQTQHPYMGGFCKTNAEDEMPDPLHSFLGLSVFSILGVGELDGLDTEFVLPKRVIERWKSIKFT